MKSSLAKVLAHRLSGLGFAAALSVGLMLVSYLRIAGDATSLAFSNIVHDSVVAGPIWGTTLGRNIVLFVIALTLLHLALGVVVWLLARLSMYAAPNVKASRNHWILAWFCVCGVSLLVANAALFSESSLGAPYAKAVRAEFFGINLFKVTIGLAVAAAFGVVVAACVRRLRAGGLQRTHGAVATAVIVSVVAAFAIPSKHTPPVALQKPHVILIGLDSFRYDAVVGKGPAHAPNVARFISNSASFSDATTPLARTFPSWVSILTGRNPHTTGAVINLLPRDMIETGGTLGDLFRTAGYHTVYAIDEVRFSNVDSTYGFDQTITPPIGASDFLIGWFGDTPLSNLMVNTRLGALLFPHLYANRAASKVYDPDQFIARLSRELRFDRPTFFAVHFTLPHWPFSWANSPTTGKPDKDYPIVVARVDQQFGDLMAMLERRGALTNALVIVLSDHGESFALDGDTLLHDSSLGALFEKHKSPRGHGTDVLSPEQYRVVLGMRAFGTCPIRLPVGQTIDAPVSLEDIAPTLADLFALPTSARFDGRSLRGLLEQAPGAGEAFRDRVRFTESEFNPVGFASGTFSASAAAAAALFYTVHPVTDRIEVRRNRLDEILEQREYAAFRSEELLAALPHELGTGFNLVAAARDGTRSQLLTTTPGPNAYPELESLWVALEERFKLAQRRASPNGIKN